MTTFTDRLFGSWAKQRKAQLDELRLMWRALRKDWLALFSIVVILFFILAAIFAPYLTPYPEQGRGDPDIQKGH